MQAYGTDHAQTVCTRAINGSVTELLTAEEWGYTDLVTVSRQETGEIQSLEANTVQINRLKATVTDIVLERLEEPDVQTMSIPLGSLTGSSFLSGRGPLLTLRSGITATVLTNIRSEFTSAGINQTCHRLYIGLEAELFTALPGEHRTVTVNTEFLVAETIMAGAVPDVFADWNQNMQ